MSQKRSSSQRPNSLTPSTAILPLPPEELLQQEVLRLLVGPLPREVLHLDLYVIVCWVHVVYLVLSLPPLQHLKRHLMQAHHEGMD